MANIKGGTESIDRRRIEGTPTVAALARRKVDRIQLDCPSDTVEKTNHLLVCVVNSGAARRHFRRIEEPGCEWPSQTLIRRNESTEIIARTAFCTTVKDCAICALRIAGAA
jgi:hypothetical protein